MIRYALQCPRGHEFEGWFGRSADFDTQRDDAQLLCPECGSGEIEKAIMSPQVQRSDAARSPSAETLDAMRDHIGQTCEDVGPDFAHEARAMHEGKAKPRGILGQATRDEAAALHEDGIAAMPLPPALDPRRSKRKLN